MGIKDQKLNQGGPVGASNGVNGSAHARVSDDANGSSPHGSYTNINPVGLSAGQLSEILNELVTAHKLGTGLWGFVALVSTLKQIRKVNPHQHITGSICSPELLKRVIRIYENDPVAQTRFLDYVESQEFINAKERKGFFDQPEATLVGWLERRIPLDHQPGEFAESDLHLNMVRLAFQSNHSDTTELFREGYRKVGMENLEDGIGEVWLRTTMGDYTNESYALAALEGAKQAELESGGALRVKFLAGMRKSLIASPNGNGKGQEMDPINPLSLLRGLSTDADSMIIGVDSVGVDAGWTPDQQASLRADAANRNMRIAVHFGESWVEGGLIETLESLNDLVSNGLLNHVDNVNALFAVRDEGAPDSRYTPTEWAAMADLQYQVIRTLMDRRIVLGINPTSNDWLTRSLRQREGWRFRKLDELFGAGLPSAVDLMDCEYGAPGRLQIVVGNDNSRIYPSRIEGAHLTVSEDLASIWSVPGRSNGCVYGALPTDPISRLILNGWDLVEQLARPAAEQQTQPLRSS